MKKKTVVEVRVQDQASADALIPGLLAADATERHLRIDPMRGLISLNEWIKPWLHCGSCNECYELSEAVPDLDGHSHGRDQCAKCGREGWMCSAWGDEQRESFESGDRYADGDMAEECAPRIDRVTVAGGTGPDATPLHPDWVRSIRDQCRAAGVEFVFEGWGEWEPYGDARSESVRDPDLMRWVGLDGSVHSGDVRPSPAYRLMQPVGPQAAGRLLDGVLHEAKRTKRIEDLSCIE